MGSERRQTQPFLVLRAYLCPHTPQTTREVSHFPLPNLNLSGIDWVIVGGESGPKSRPMNLSWVVDIRNQCQVAIVPSFFKQWGGQNRKKTGRVLEGETWDEMSTVKEGLVAGAGFEPATFRSHDQIPCPSTYSLFE